MMKAPAYPFLLLCGLPLMAFAAPSLRAPHATIAIPGGEHGIGFDDIGYAAALDRVMVPAGATGNLVLVTPGTGAISVIHGVSAHGASAARHREGTTSAVYADGYLFASDHDPAEVVTIDPQTHKVIARTPLESGPDYVRYAARTHEIWVTEPDKEQIQVFKLTLAPQPQLTPETTIAVAGGPESLEIDNARDRAYSNQWKGRTVEMSLSAHKVLAAWPDTCKKGSHGIAVDSVHDHVFVGCGDGKVVTLAPRRGGKVVATAHAGAGVDIISYSPRLHHLYVPGAHAATLAIFDANPDGKLIPLATYRTANGAHCVADDNAGHVFVCDPRAGTLLEIDDH